MDPNATLRELLNLLCEAHDRPLSGEEIGQYLDMSNRLGGWFISGGFGPKLCRDRDDDVFYLDVPEPKKGQ